MILIDTSAWIEFFKGRRRVAELVDRAIDTNTAALCGPVLTELGRGLHQSERSRVLDLLGACHTLDQPPDLWRSAGELGFALKSKGVTAKTIDLLIGTYALFHQVALLTVDRDFEHWLKAGVNLYLTSTR